MKVLSLFDGMSCGMVALQKANINVDTYYASEIDKFAIQISEKNYPSIKRLGDVEDVSGYLLPKIDLLIGGSPCQGFSFAGKQLAFDDPRSKLFFEYVRILKECREVNPSIRFLLENVRMKKEYLDIISENLGVEPVCINSALVSAQNRIRYYWCNWEVTQPEDRHIYLKDILQPEKEVDSKYYLTPEKVSKIDFSGLEKYIKKDIKIRGHNKKYRTSYQLFDTAGKTECLTTCQGGGRHPHIIYKINKKGIIKHNQNKASCFTAGGHSGGGSRSDMDAICVAQHGRNIVDGKRKDYKGAPTIQRFEERKDSKTNCLTTVHKDNLVFLIGEYWYVIRRLTPLECERLQTLYDNYTQGVSDNQRYKMCGNGWNTDTIEHVFRCGLSSEGLDGLLDVHR